MSTYLPVIMELPDLLSIQMSFLLKVSICLDLWTLETLIWHFRIIGDMFSGFIYCDMQLIV